MLLRWILLQCFSWTAWNHICVLCWTQGKSRKFAVIWLFGWKFTHRFKGYYILYICIPLSHLFTKMKFLSYIAAGLAVFYLLELSVNGSEHHIKLPKRADDEFSTTAKNFVRARLSHLNEASKDRCTRSLKIVLKVDVARKRGINSSFDTSVRSSACTVLMEELGANANDYIVDFLQKNMHRFWAVILILQSGQDNDGNKVERIRHTIEIVASFVADIS